MRMKVRRIQRTAAAEVVVSTSHPPSKPPLSPLHPQSSSISASHDSPSVHLGTGGEDSSSHPSSKPPLSSIAPELSSITANNCTPPVHFGTDGEGSISHSPSKPPQSMLPQQPSSITAIHDTPAVHFGQISRRRSPRLLDCNNGGTGNSFDINNASLITGKESKFRRVKEIMPPKHHSDSCYL